MGVQEKTPLGGVWELLLAGFVAEYILLAAQTLSLWKSSWLHALVRMFQVGERHWVSGWDALNCGQRGFPVPLRFSEVPSLTLLLPACPEHVCFLHLDAPCAGKGLFMSLHDLPLPTGVLTNIYPPWDSKATILMQVWPYFHHSCGSLLPLSGVHTLPAIQGLSQGSSPPLPCPPPF